jgi:hypothetical protein
MASREFKRPEECALASRERERLEEKMNNEQRRMKNEIALR